jgi:mono/diheme cytochrome c family protein
MYDKWWVMNNSPAPTGQHPLYPPAGQQSGSGTFRCKECHGWDYKGVDGAYGPGSSHHTGIIGVFASTKTPAEMFDILKKPNGDGTGGTTSNGHNFGNIGLSDSDVNDIVEFLQTLLIDTDTLIDANGVFIGDANQGQLIYTGSGACMLCHGADGTTLNFGSPEDPEWVGTVAVENPWEFQHKMRIGQPGADPEMPGWSIGGGSDQAVADVGLYSQQNFPTSPQQPAPVPTASHWSAIIGALMVLVFGTTALRRARNVTPS